MSDLVRGDAPAAVLEQVLGYGDLTKLSGADRLGYYRMVCESIGVNPLTRPLEFLQLSGKLVLYANKECAAQLRSNRGVSITRLESRIDQGIYTVKAEAKLGDRVDSDMAGVPIEGLKGQELANAYMKCATKAKRRVTLSICGLGILDESEVADIPDARRVTVDDKTGEIQGGDPTADRDALMEEIRHLGDQMNLPPEVRTDLWVKHVGLGLNGRVITADQADVAQLTDLVLELRRRAA